MQSTQTAVIAKPLHNIQTLSTPPVIAKPLHEIQNLFTPPVTTTSISPQFPHFLEHDFLSDELNLGKYKENPLFIFK